MVPTILPTLSAAKWAEVDLDAESRRLIHEAGTNPLLDPDACARFVADVAAALGVDHTLGGYLEDRSHLWRGHYHDPGTMRHLGIDLNAPAGTPVVAAADCMVERVVRDDDRHGGWGGLVMMRLDVPNMGARGLLYGHLGHRDLPEAGRRLRAGDHVGLVGIPDENGGWYPHLHVQHYDDTVRATHLPRLEGMDGYGPNGTGAVRGFPDPRALVIAGPV